MPRRPRRGGRLGTYVRYNWHVVLLHLLLIVLGFLNLYPFFWMLGTSIKAEAEASNERDTPLPGWKYKLAPSFSLDSVLPLSMQEDANASDRPVARMEELKQQRRRLQQQLNRIDIGRAAAAPGEVEQLKRRLDAVGRQVSATANLLERLKKKLEVLHALQSDGWKGSVDHRVELALADIDPNCLAAKARVDSLRKEAAQLQAAATAARRSPRRELRATAGGLEARWADASERADKAAEQARRVFVGARESALRSLLAAGVLVRDAAGCLWMTDAGFRGDQAGLGERDGKVAELLRDHFALTPKRYAQIAQYDMPTSLAQIEALARRGLLTGVSGGGEQGVWRLADGARGKIYKDLAPRQILVLWNMHDENVRRSESRNTYADDRRSALDYAKDTGLAGAGLGAGVAAAELGELRRQGYLDSLLSGTVCPINYWVVLKEENFLLYFLTSTIITIFCVFGTIWLSSMLGYALVRVRFPGKLVIFGVMIAAAILPGEARMIPTFKMLHAAGMMQNLWGMVLWLTSFGVGNALLMAGFFWTLPKEVDEAAAVDGAGPLQTFLDVAMPMARPIVMTVGLFAFLNAWNNFLVPLLCTIARPSMQPLAVAVYSFQMGHAGKWHEINAAASIMIVPVIGLFLLVQKHVVKAIAVGAVKG